MHTVEMDASAADLRSVAMHSTLPIHTFMFNSKGTLLGANASALEACYLHTPGDAALNVCLLLLQCTCR